MASVALPPSVRALHDGIERRMTDVRQVQIPRLGTCTLATELTEWESELHATLHRLSSMVAQLESEQDEAESPEERDGIEAATKEAKRSLTSLRTESRRALLAAHRATLSQQASMARAALLGHAPEREARMPTDRAHATSDQLTTALQRTVALMSGELEKSGYSAQLLEESSDTIAQVSQRYTSFNELLRNSISLVRQMERAELMDLGMLVGSMAFFAACVVYILYVRVLSKGLWALSLTWRATGYVSSGALGGVSSLATMVATQPPQPPQPPVATRDALDDWMPRGYREDEVLYADDTLESTPSMTHTLVHTTSSATHATSTLDEPRMAEADTPLVTSASTQSLAPAGLERSVARTTDSRPVAVSEPTASLAEQTSSDMPRSTAALESTSSEHTAPSSTALASTPPTSTVPLPSATNVPVDAPSAVDDSAGRPSDASSSGRPARSTRRARPWADEL
ncbi:Protein transport protein sec20 [Malassezia caprae]|uniref:Protein transport protein sec20 n=1 Tax=Malassezia caprae TaxID=1381934 RepID=A0AAF0EBZ0_9BASI|nr:Protein transport protein sec20 [Malassezia caprae]